MALALRFVAALLLAASSCLAAANAAPTVDGIEAVYNFGDSISDTGNLVREGGSGMMEPIKHFPYGQTISRPTGRCSDGLLMIDFLARYLGLPLLNPYLAKNANFAHGVNFAVAGATALSVAELANRGINDPFTNSSLDVQLGWFKDFINANTNSDQEVRDKLSNSLVMVGEIGGNDYNYALISNIASGGNAISNSNHMIQTSDQVMNLISDVVQTIINTAKELLDMGAVRMVIPGNFPIGCMPSYLTIMNGTDPIGLDGNNCLTSLNLFAEKHNKRLQEAIQRLRTSYPDAIISYADYYGAYIRMLHDSSKMGFDETASLTACCGSGGNYNFDMARMCGSPGTTVCAKPKEYISWDGIHLTQQAYRVMANLLYRKGFATPSPIALPRSRSQP